MPSSLIVNIGKSGDMNIQALQDRLNDAQELKEHAEAVFDDACNAVEAAETRKSDDEVMAAIKQVHRSAQSSFLKARQKVKDAEASLQAAKNEAENNSKMSIPGDDQKPAAAPAPKDAVKNGTTRVAPEHMAVQVPVGVKDHDNISDITNVISEKQTAKKRAVEDKSNTGDVGETQGSKSCAKKAKATTSSKVYPPQELTVRGCSISTLNGVYTKQRGKDQRYLKLGVWDGRERTFLIERSYKNLETWVIRFDFCLLPLYTAVGEMDAPPLKGWKGDYVPAAARNPPEIVYG